MNRRILFALALFAVVGAGLGCDHDSCSPGGLCFLAEAEFHEEIPVAGENWLYLRGSNGNVSLTAESGTDRITVRATKRAHADSQDIADSLVDSVQVVITVHEEMILVLVQSPLDAAAGGWVVDFEIVLPPECSYRVEIKNGGIRAAGARAGAVLVTTNGDIVVQDGEGPTVLGTTNGNVEADLTVVAPQVTSLTSTNGSLTLTVPATTSARVALGTTNGTVSIQGLSLRDADITTGHASGCLGTCDGEMRLRTINGNVTLKGR